MAERIDSKRVARLFFSSLLHNRNPVPRIGVDRHPGIRRDPASCLWDAPVTTGDYGGLSIKSQAISRDTAHPVEPSADGIIRAADRIMRELSAGLIEGPLRHQAVGLCQHEGWNTNQKPDCYQSYLFHGHLSELKRIYEWLLLRLGFRVAAARAQNWM